ncbi:MAG: hypothetical protein ACK5MP_02010 [Nostocoides sp.]
MDERDATPGMSAHPLAVARIGHDGPCSAAIFPARHSPVSFAAAGA